MEPQKKPIHLNENDTPYLYEPFRNQMPAKRPHPAAGESSACSAAAPASSL